MSDDYISGAKKTVTGVPTSVEKGREYAIIELGRLKLTLADGDYLVYVPNFAGKIIGILALVDVPTTDANADGTITAEINGSAVTGGVITVADTAAGATAFTPLDKSFVGTNITAGNAFNASDQLNIAWAWTNAFADGVARVLLVCVAY